MNPSHPDDCACAICKNKEQWTAAPPEINTIEEQADQCAAAIFHDHYRNQQAELVITEDELAKCIQTQLEALNTQWQAKYAQTMDTWSAQSVDQQSENDRLRALVHEERGQRDIYKGRLAESAPTLDHMAVTFAAAWVASLTLRNEAPGYSDTDALHEANMRGIEQARAMQEIFNPK